MQAEIAAAVKWWRKQLEEPAEQNNGDAFQTAFCSGIAAMKFIRPTDGQLAKFEAALTEILTDYYRDRWPTDNPDAGSYLRTIFNDYGADPRLAQACAAAGIRCGMLTFPCKTAMHVNPGSVTVRCGYGAEEITIYPTKEIVSE